MKKTDLLVSLLMQNIADQKILEVAFFSLFTTKTWGRSGRGGNTPVGCCAYQLKSW